MPALDYVSIIRSVYGARWALLFGAFNSAGIAAVSALKANAPILFVMAAALLLVGFIRFANMRAFWHAGIGNEDAEAAERWEQRALVGGALVAVAHGIWCLVAILIVRDPFAELASITLTIAATVGLVARNFGLDRLLTVQILSLSVTLWIAMILRGDFYYQLLADMLVLLLINFRKLAGDVRAILLSAVHGRAEVSRLAAELDIAITTLQHGLLMLDENGMVTLVNERALKTLALFNVQKPIGQHYTAILDALNATGRVPERSIARLSEMIGQRTSGKGLLSIDGGAHYEVTLSSRRSRSVLLLEDITERVTAEERINFIARHDTLTELPNRSYFGELALEALQKQAAAGTSSALMIIDLDEFKHVNDSFGHIVGDMLLEQVADRLKKAAPEGAILARLGGDEFIMLSPYSGNAQLLADRVLDAFQAPFSVDGLNLPSKVSVGLVTSADSSDELDELMTKADLALFAAKSGGRGRSQLFHAQMDIDYHYRQRLKADLRDAVANGELSLAFQPLFDIDTRRVVSCEALARWNHAELGPVPPATFIPLAEEMGLISDITAWVVKNAARECSQWPGAVGVAVNVSARDFRGLDLPELIDAALVDSALPAARFEIEVTETAVIEERELANRTLKTLADKGIAIALDDFGTGYSSLSYLNALPFTKLKIDRSFLVDIATKPRALRLLASVARLGRDLDLTVVAEGVETEAQLEAMVAHTLVQQVQGYHFSRPLPARDISELIARFNSGASKDQAAENRKHG